MAHFLAAAPLIATPFLLSLLLARGVSEISRARPLLERVHRGLTWVPVSACLATGLLLLQARVELGRWPGWTMEGWLLLSPLTPPAPRNDALLLPTLSLYLATLLGLFLWLGLEHALKTFLQRREPLWKAGFFWGFTLALGLFLFLDPGGLASWML